MVIFPALVSLLRIVLAISDLLWLHMDFRVDFPKSIKNEMGILNGVALNL